MTQIGALKKSVSSFIYRSVNDHSHSCFITCSPISMHAQYSINMFQLSMYIYFPLQPQSGLFNQHHHQRAIWLQRQPDVQRHQRHFQHPPSPSIDQRRHHHLDAAGIENRFTSGFHPQHFHSHSFNDRTAHLRRNHAWPSVTHAAATNPTKLRITLDRNNNKLRHLSVSGARNLDLHHTGTDSKITMKRRGSKTNIIISKNPPTPTNNAPDFDVLRGFGSRKEISAPAVFIRPDIPIVRTSEGSIAIENLAHTQGTDTSIQTQNTFSQANTHFAPSTKIHHTETLTASQDVNANAILPASNYLKTETAVKVHRAADIKPTKASLVTQGVKHTAAAVVGKPETTTAAVPFHEQPLLKTQVHGKTVAHVETPVAVPDTTNTKASSKPLHSTLTAPSSNKDTKLSANQPIMDKNNGQKADITTSPQNIDKAKFETQTNSVLSQSSAAAQQTGKASHVTSQSTGSYVAVSTRMTTEEPDMPDLPDMGDTDAPDGMD